MRMVKRIHSRLLLVLLIAIACVRMVARVLPISRTARDAKRETQRLGVKQGPLFRAQGYILHPIGAFPYVRVTASDPLTTAPVPIEIVALSKKEQHSPDNASRPVLAHKKPSTVLKPFCDPACDSCDCTECGCGCTDCTDCGTDCACSTFTTTTTDVCA
jgi:hypothetical protein